MAPQGWSKTTKNDQNWHFRIILRGHIFLSNEDRTKTIISSKSAKVEVFYTQFEVHSIYKKTVQIFHLPFSSSLFIIFSFF